MQHIYGFNALRAFSVTLVILSHIGIMKQIENPIARQFFSVFNANYGVKTFFVLSGFLITTLLIREYEKQGRISIPNFMVRRALRILPLYFLIVAFLSSLALAGIAKPQWNGMLYSAAFIYNYAPKVDTINYMNHLWSLAVEEQFYLFWPLIFAAIFPRRSMLAAGCAALIVVCFFNWPLPGYAKEYSTATWTIPAIYPILFGALMAAVTTQYGDSLRPLRIAVIALALISLPLLFTRTATVEFLGTFGIALLICWIFLNQQRRSVQMLDWGPIGYIGIISYGLYMWQGVLTGNGTWRDIPTWPPSPYVGILLTLIIAPLSFHFFERPISSMRSRFRDRPTRESQDTVPALILPKFEPAAVRVPAVKPEALEPDA